jgi:glucose/arabinose dehydrogenase
MRRATLIAPLAATVIALAGCGSSQAPTTASRAKSPDQSPTTAQDAPSALEHAAREAVVRDHELLVSALTRNRVPANPRGTAGPALADIRQAVAQRRKQRVTVRMLSDKFRVLGVQLDPSYTTATATVLDVQHVQPSYGHIAGKVVVFHDHARLQLRRLGDTLRFVVWKVELLR